MNFNPIVKPLRRHIKKMYHLHHMVRRTAYSHFTMKPEAPSRTRSHAATSQVPVIATAIAPRHGAKSPPPLSTVMRCEVSTPSTLGVSSTIVTVARRSLPRKLVIHSTEGSVSSPLPSRSSSLQRSESAALVGGASLPPKSPKKATLSIVDAVGIPAPKKRGRLQIGTLTQSCWICCSGP